MGRLLDAPFFGMDDEHLTFMVTEVGLLNKTSCLAAALGVTKFIILLAMNLVTLLCCLVVKQTGL
jgi:hypothetical protein